MITVWITKYALTLGILTEQVEEPPQDIPTVVRARAMGPSAYFHGKDWYRVRTDAVARAEYMRRAKLVSLRKQIAKLENKNFS